MYCGECGYRNEKGAKFCERCGAKLEVENHKKKTFKVLPIIIIGIVIIGIFTIYKVNNHSNWSNIYYDYLKEYDDKLFDDPKVSFIDVSEIKEPVMVIKSTKDSDTYTNVYYIKNYKVVSTKKNDKPSNSKLLYNKDTKKYNWYIKSRDDDKENYVPIVNLINDNSKEKEYTLDEGKQDEKFVEPKIEIVETNLTDINENTIKNLAKEYKTTDELVTKDVESEVKEELSNNNLKAGKYTLKYGDYTYTTGSYIGGRLTFNKDKTFKYTNQLSRISFEGRGTYDIVHTDNDEKLNKEAWLLKLKFNYYYVSARSMPKIKEQTFVITDNNTFKYRENDDGVFLYDDGSKRGIFKLNNYEFKYGTYESYCDIIQTLERIDIKKDGTIVFFQTNNIDKITKVYGTYTYKVGDYESMGESLIAYDKNKNPVIALQTKDGKTLASNDNCAYSFRTETHETDYERNYLK